MMKPKVLFFGCWDRECGHSE